MTTRVLPQAEWYRVAHTELGVALEALPAESQVVVVEDDAGEVIGVLAAMRFVHMHGMWVAPAHRRRGPVFRRLLRGLAAAAGRWGHAAIFTTAVSHDIEEMLLKLGGRQLPGVPYAFPAGGK